MDVLDEVHPVLPTIRTTQDKFRQEVPLRSHAHPIAPFLDVVWPTVHAAKMQLRALDFL